MEKAEVFNNGGGWRITFYFKGNKILLTEEEVAKLAAILNKALIDIFWKKAEDACDEEWERGWI